MSGDRAGAAERWQRVQALFHAALERPAAEREAWLAGQADQEVAREALDLLAADAHGPLGDREGAPQPAEWVGPWRLLGLIGEGGMGAVYLAEREGEGFTQRAALKLVRAGIVDPGLAARFVAERRILARLEHPNIARMIDGGATPAGQPFLAMEFVEGRALPAWVAVERPSLEARLRLFIEVCETVHYAHQQLVVHRDLKPGNIMVGADGRPRLLDFGIARLLDPSDGLEHVTGTAPWLTPAYASPEQVRGRRVSTLTDVYSLGVILYELLAGARPHLLDGLTPAQITSVLAEQDPKPPSTRVPDPQVRRRLEGDLDVIALKALARDPARRYASAEQLADDVRRHLDGRPVLARPDSLAYRTRKFVGRHRTAVTAAALGLAALGAGVVGTVWQARAASRAATAAAAQARRAERVSALLVELFRLSDPTQLQGDTLSARALLDEGTARIVREFGDEPAIQADLFTQVAGIYANLGLFDRAENLLRQAIALRGPAAPPAERAPPLAELGRVLVARGEPEEGIASLEQALAIGGLPDTTVAGIQADLGWTLHYAGEHGRAADLFGAALATRRATLGDQDPRTASTLLGLAAAEHDLGRFDAAERLFAEVLRHDSLRLQPTPLAATAFLEVGLVRRLREQYAEAEPLVRTGWEMRRRLFEVGHPDRLDASQQWAAVLVQLGRYAEAESVVHEALGEAVAGGVPDHPLVASLQETLGLLLVSTGRFDEAFVAYDEAVARKRLLHGEGHPAVQYTLIGVANAHAVALRTAEAGRRFAALHGAMEAANPGGVSVGRLLVVRGLGQVAMQQGRYDEAGRRFALADSMARGLLRAGHRYRLRLLEDQAALALAQGRPRDARLLAGEALAGRRATYRGPHDNTGRALVLLGSALLADGEPAAAGEHFREALRHLETLPPGHWRVGEAMGLLGLAECRAGQDATGAEHLAEGLRRVRAHLGTSSAAAGRAAARAGRCGGGAPLPRDAVPLELS